MSTIFIVAGLVLSTAGSFLLGWSMLEPRIWPTEKLRYDAKLTALFTASQKGDEFHPDDDAAATKFANMMQHFYLEELRRKAMRKVGRWGVAVMVAGFLLQLVGTLLQ